MRNSITTIYEKILNNSFEQTQKTPLTSLAKAYSLVTEKTAFYSKEFPDNVNASPDITGFKNLGFVEKPDELNNIIDGISLRSTLEILFKEGGWNSSNVTQLKDFEISFLTPICQKLAKSGITKNDLKYLIANKSRIDTLETKIIENTDPFDLLTTVEGGVGFATKELIEFCYYRSGKTVNDVTFGDGEVLITLFTNGKKGSDEGDIVFPKAKKVEIKASEGRIDKPAKDAFYKTNIRNFLIRINKKLISASKANADLEMENNQKELSLFIDTPTYKQVFNTNVFDEKLIEITIDFNTKTFVDFKNNFFRYKLPKETKLEQNPIGVTLEKYKSVGYLNSVFDTTDQKNRDLFRDVYNQLKLIIDKFKIGTTKAAIDVFDKSGGTFIRNFFLQDFGLSLEETAEAFTLCSQNTSYIDSIKGDIIQFLNKDDNFNKLKSGDESILQSIIFALQLVSYSKDNFDYILVINKNTHSCVSFKCNQSPSLFMELVNRYIELKTQNKIDLAIQIDSRGGSQVSLLC